MINYSPLRYPGGKSALYPIIASAIKTNGLKNCTYVEPFAGGASIALSLLVDGVVDRIVINDADKAVYSFWRAIIESPRWFVEKIENTPVTVHEWRKQRTIVETSKKYSKELGFAMFYLNRTNRSGILSAGPIGGYEQNGNYKIDCRFNKDSLIEKIKTISKHRNRIKVYNQDISAFIKKYLPSENVDGDVFIYFDPPYYEKGQRLYLNHFSSSDHERLKADIAKINCKWIMTYDDKVEIERLYSDFEKCHFSINYSLSNKTKGGELMIFKDRSCVPPLDTIKTLSKAVCFDNAKIGGEKMENCRFCNIVSNINHEQKIENTVVAEVDNYFAISSIGALVEGWTLVIPKKHCCSMKELYSCAEFKQFAEKIVKALSECYGSVIAFEHGPNREGSDTSCGTDHAHIHFVPYRSIVSNLNAMDLEWNDCRASEVSRVVGDNEYLFYCDLDDTWDDPLGRVHILKTPISQFFRKVIAQDQGNMEKFNYKTNPDITLTLKTIDRLQKYFTEQSGG